MQRRYEEDSLIVETMFETARGEVRVTDFMPPRERNSDVVRVVRGLRGRVAMRMDTRYPVRLWADDSVGDESGR